MGEQQIEWGPRVRLALVVVAVLLVVPVVVGTLLGGELAAVGLVIGAALSVASAASAGMTAARLAAPAVTLAAVLGSMTAGGWPWVVVVAGFAAVAGAASARQATGSFLLAAVVASVAPETGDVASALWLGAFVAIGCAYGLAVATRAGVADLAEPPTTTVSPVVLAIGLGALGAVTAAIALAVDVDEASWIPMTALVLALPTTSGVSARSRERIIGTLVGAGIALGLGLLSAPRVVFVAVSVLAMLAIIATAGLRYRVQATFITLLVLLAGGAPRQDVVERRVLFTVIGAVALVVGAVVLTEYARRRSPGQVGPSGSTAS